MGEDKAGSGSRCLNCRRALGLITWSVLFHAGLHVICIWYRLCIAVYRHGPERVSFVGGDAPYLEQGKRFAWLSCKKTNTCH